MKWQKARILNIPGYQTYRTAGKECWVQGRPLEPDYLDYSGPPGSTLITRADEPRLVTNVCDYDGPMAIFTRCLELLPDFANDVPLIPWEEFVK